MASIHVMDEALANKIAAGEVVERPASIVKELVENAIDAASTVIEIDVQNGGMDGIRVVDNGHGMDREDSQRAFERHATSKLVNERQLFRIGTLGFRGEALPSIASVARVILQSWDGKEAHGVKVVVQGGKMEEIEDAPPRPGTTIEVRDLFFNTPARYKYVKTVHTELGHITDYVNRLALSYPRTSFTLRHNDRLLLRTNGNGKRKESIAAVYGRKTMSEMIQVQATHIDFSLDGWISTPEATRSNRQYMSIILNGRYIRHYPLQQAIIEAYQTRLPINRYPIAVLCIDLDPSLIDVNVHPSKLSVRVSKESELTSWITSELIHALDQAQQIPHPLAQKTTFSKKSIIPQKSDLNSQQAADQTETNQHNEQIDHPKAVQQPSFSFQLPRKNMQPYRQEHGSVTNTHVHESNQVPYTQQSGKQNPNPVEQTTKIPLLSPLCQFHGTYVLAQNENGLYIVDQHAAQERIWYEHFYEKLGEVEPRQQQLLVPLVLEYRTEEWQWIMDHLDNMERVGLTVNEFGKNTIIVRAYPYWFPDGEEESLIRAMIEHMIEEEGDVHWSKFRDEQAKLMSCKQAIKANRVLSHAEMESLLEQLRHSSNPYTCPHGRPITVLFSVYDIEKMFKRVMT